MKTITIPRIGEFWPEQGGFYAGILRGIQDQPDYHLIVSIKETEFNDKWGPSTKVEGARNANDGLANTRAMAACGSKLAEKILALESSGQRDWYLPSRTEASLCFLNLAKQFEPSWYWTSTEYSAHYAFVVGFEDGYVGYDGKNGHRRVRAVRRVSLENLRGEK